MYTPAQLVCRVLILVIVVVAWAPAAAQQLTPISDNAIAALQTELSEAKELTSSARQKIALRRVVREAESLIEQNQAAPNRFEVLSVLFRTQQVLFQIQGNEANRRAIMETCQKLAQAPNQYADIRWDADLLLSQAQVARQGGGVHERANAMRELVERYLGTSVEKKVVRIALLSAVEAGEARLIDYLDQLISERHASDPEMIAFKRDKLPGRVFGATFYANLRDSKGNAVRFPMDAFGMTTAFLFWSNDKDGRANLKEIAEELRQQEAAEDDRRLVIISINLDELPDAGESILREHGLDWTALHLPGGRDSPIYQAYARVDPKFVTISPTGIASLFQTGGNMHGKGFKRWLGSSKARAWVQPAYCNPLQSLLSAEFLVLDPKSDFDPAVPPEFKVLASPASTDTPRLERTDRSVPESTLRAIQACFIPPPRRYSAPRDEVLAGYQRAAQLCAEAIKAHPDAPDLWLVRNRRIVALMGLWKLKFDPAYLKDAAAEAQAFVDADYPPGTDAIARLCLARQALHAPEADARAILLSLADPYVGEPLTAPALATAALLAMELGDRETYTALRQSLLDQYGDHPSLWPMSAFMLDRYRRYWLYQIPFVSGHIYGRRELYGISSLDYEQSVRFLDVPLQSMEGKSARFPELAGGKWAVINLIQVEQIARLSDKPDAYIAERPFDDIRVFNVMLHDDADAIRTELAKRKAPLPDPVFVVSDDVRETIERQFMMQHDPNRPSLLILRPDGSVALAASAMTHRGMGRHGRVTATFFRQEDETRVEEAIAAGNLEEAKHIAFANAPIGTPFPPANEPNRKPSPMPDEHLRARAKVYMALGDWQAAKADVDLLHTKLLEHAGSMSMRTAELDQVEQMRQQILEALEQAGP